MITISQQQALWRWDRIPEKLREVLTSEVSSDFVWSVCGDQHLPEDKIKLVSKLAGYVISGFLHPEDLAREIKIQAGVPEQIAAAIADGLNKRIFAPIRSDMDAVFNPRPDDEPLEEDAEGEGESSPILFQEIRPPRQNLGEAGPSTAPPRPGSPQVPSGQAGQVSTGPLIQLPSKNIGVSVPQPSLARPQPRMDAANPIRNPGEISSSALIKSGGYASQQQATESPVSNGARSNSSFIPPSPRMPSGPAMGTDKEGVPTFQPGWSHPSPLKKDEGQVPGEPQTKSSSGGASPSGGQGSLHGGQLPQSTPSSTSLPKPLTQTAPTTLPSSGLLARPNPPVVGEGGTRGQVLDSRLRGNDKNGGDDRKGGDSGNGGGDGEKNEIDIVPSVPIFQQPKEVPLAFSSSLARPKSSSAQPPRPSSAGPQSSLARPPQPSLDRSQVPKPPPPLGKDEGQAAQATTFSADSSEPMPVILHEEPKAVPTKSSGFSFTPRPPSLSDVTLSTRNIPPKPAVFEFGASTTAPKVVHYSEMKTPLPPMPPKP